VLRSRWRRLLLAVVLLVVGVHVVLHFAITRCWGCPGQELSPPGEGELPIEAAILPGCPSAKDGSVSGCQWRRVLWAKELYDRGVVRSFVASGGAVYNRYVEAEALRAGLAALGVPLDAIQVETQALHTDENLAFSLRLATGRVAGRTAIVSDELQVVVGCSMLRMWGVDCLPLPMDEELVEARMTEGVPMVRTLAVPEARWMSLEEREAARAEAMGSARRRSSNWVYFWGLLRGLVGLGVPPEQPPEGL